MNQVHTLEDSDEGTRERVLRLIVEQGPITAAEMARALSLTAAAVRRHLGFLEDSEQVKPLAEPASVKRGRGRPAKRYVANSAAHDQFSSDYADAALKALELLAEHAGPAGVTAFAQSRSDSIRERYASALHEVGDDVAARAERLADLLARDGYAATARPMGEGIAVQLCQGHCPIHDIASEYPQLCEAETRAFSELLGVHVQRLATLAGGGHVCTTHIPVKILTRKENE